MTDSPNHVTAPALTHAQREQAARQLRDSFPDLSSDVLDEIQAYGDEKLGGLSFFGDLIGPGVVVTAGKNYMKDVFAPALKSVVRLLTAQGDNPEYAESVQLLPAHKGQGHVYISDAALHALQGEAQAFDMLRAQIAARAQVVSTIER